MTFNIIDVGKEHIDIAYKGKTVKLSGMTNNSGFLVFDYDLSNSWTMDWIIRPDYTYATFLGLDHIPSNPNATEEEQLEFFRDVQMFYSKGIYESGARVRATDEERLEFMHEILAFYETEKGGFKISFIGDK
jgi:hypothetical protein